MIETRACDRLRTGATRFRWAAVGTALASLAMDGYRHPRLARNLDALAQGFDEWATRLDQAAAVACPPAPGASLVARAIPRSVWPLGTPT